MDEYPEITQADFNRANLRRNMEPVEKKQRITIMLDAGVVGYFKSKAGKRGYQTLINESLKKVIAENQSGPEEIEATLRKINREEFAALSNA